MRLFALVTALFASGCCTRLAQAPPKPPPPSTGGSLAIEERYHLWHDARRNRNVPVKIYSPAAADSYPVVVFSHGIGEDRDSYQYLGRALARNGFTAVHITHAGTDRAVLERGYRHLYEATRQPENWINRPLDVSFVLDQLGAGEAIVAGHSAGAFTAFALAGVPLARGETFRDRRVRAIIPMSMPRMESVIAEGGYRQIGVPALNITGTCDASVIYRTLPRHRRVPFELTDASGQTLITLRDVNHNTFSNATDEHHPLIAQLTVLFARAHLRNDGAARAWFDEAGATPAMTLERK